MDILFRENDFDIDNLKTEIKDNGTAHISIIASSDTGKNVLLFNILTKIGRFFKYIHVLTGTDVEQYQNIAFGNRILEIPRKEGSVLVRKYITQLIEKIKLFKTEEPNKHLLILDDLTKEGLSPIADFLGIIRHEKISVFIVTQDIMNINCNIRPNFKYWFVKYKSSLGSVCNNSAGILNWVSKEIKEKDIEKQLKYYKNDRLKSKCAWIGIQCSIPRYVGVYNIPTNFYEKNFEIINGKSRFSKELLSHQCYPKEIKSLLEMET